MKTSLIQAIELLFSGSKQLANIVGVTMRMGLTSSLLALLIGVPIGIFLGSYIFPGKRALVVINRTLVSMPPVVCGLICYLMFSGVGPLRHLKLLYTVKGMVIAQVILLTPVVINNMETYVSGIAPAIRETARGLRLGFGRTMLLVANESVYSLVSTYMFALGRAFAEVGAVSMVGGAIAYKTNVMTTAIMNFTNMGDFTIALALGYILLGISLVINIFVQLLQWRFRK